MVRQSNISKLEQLAASQWGMFTTAQAQALGLRRNQISRMVDSARIEPMCYGVYRFVAGSEPAHTELKAAWLSAFPKKTAAERLVKRPFDAVAAVGTAAATLGAGDFHLSPYTFITAIRRQTARKDIKFLSCSLDAADVVMVDGLPTTSFERTVFDLLRLNEDPSLIDGFMRDAASNCAHTFDFERLSKLLDPIASRYGFSEGGESFAANLILRNVSDVLVGKAHAALQGAVANICESKAFQTAMQSTSAVVFDYHQGSGLSSSLKALQKTLSGSIGSLHLETIKDISLPTTKTFAKKLAATTEVLPKPDAEGIDSALVSAVESHNMSEKSDRSASKET